MSALAGVLGLFSFYDIYYGSLSWMTLGGEVSLGGRVGEMIAGPPGAMAVVRVAALLLVAAAAALPSVTKLAGQGASASLAVISYVAAVFAFGKLASAMRREKPEARSGGTGGGRPSTRGSAELSALLDEQPYNGASEGAVRELGGHGDMG